MKSLFCILAIFLWSAIAFGQKEPDKITNKQTLELPKIKRAKPPVELPTGFAVLPSNVE